MYDKTLDNKRQGGFIESFGTLHKRAKFGYYLLGVFVFYVWYQALSNVLYGGEILAYRDFTDFLIGTAINFSMVLLLFLLNTYIVFGLNFWKNSLKQIPLNLLLSQTAPLITNATFLFISFVFGKHPHIRWIQVYLSNFIIYIINELVWCVVHYIRIQNSYERSRLAVVQLEYKVFRAQVNPHFLFNSLNILYSLSHIDVPKSRQFILSLSRMYRYIMGRKDGITVRLSEELEFLQSYIEVLETLYYDSLTIKVDGLENVADHQIVPFSLQLLIENVIKHNVLNKDCHMTVRIEIGQDALRVTNNIVPKPFLPEQEKTGVGLQYLTELYNAHGQKFSYTKTDKEFSAVVPYI